MKTSEQFAAFVLFQCLKIQASAKIISKGKSFYQFYQKYFFSILHHITVTSLKSSNGLYLLSKLRIFTHRTKEISNHLLFHSEERIISCQHHGVRRTSGWATWIYVLDTHYLTNCQPAAQTVVCIIFSLLVITIIPVHKVLPWI